MTYGAIVLSLETPDRAGCMSDVVLGFSSLEQYERENPFFGAVAGRYANRIAGARFELDGRMYHLAANNAPGGIPCALHGGVCGFDRRVWKGEGVAMPGARGVRLRLESWDSEEGYPGTLQVGVTYWLTDADEWRVEYEAQTDRATPVNLTQHSFFNLKGESQGSVLGHELELFASRFTPVNEGLIPTGELRSVSGTPMDFRERRAVGARIEEKDPQLVLGRGYDLNWVIDREGDGLVPAARVTEPESGRLLEVFTSEPGIQFYTGNFLDGRLRGKSGRLYEARDGFCLETQHFPDSPNQPGFPSTILLPGERFLSQTVFRFGVK